MTEQPLISVIVPIYKVQEYLDICIKSIVEQTYENLEIILVDDGSPDECPSIVDKWASNDNRIVPVHIKNGGQSAARNLGVDIAQGDYITFIDGDDWVNADYCEHLLNANRKYDADVTVGGFQRVKNGKFYPDKTIIANTPLYYPVTVHHAAKYFLECSIALWGKLYRVDVIRDIRLPTGRLAEEYAFQIKALRNAKRVSFCKFPLYNYRIRSNSAAHSIKPKYLLDNIQAVDEAIEMCRKDFPFEVDYCRSRLASLLYHYLAADQFGRDESKQRKDVLNHALETVGGQERVLAQIEIPMDTVFYTYCQFNSYMTNAEKTKIQRDFRKVFSVCHVGFRKLILKYIPSYISISMICALLKRRQR